MKSFREPQPPKLARLLFKWYCSKDLQEEIGGDLEERFLDHIESHGLRKAKIKYWLNVFKFFRWHTIKPRKSGHQSSNRIDMLWNYIKISFRNAAKQKAYALMNITGLVLGLSSFILIMLYVQYHLDFDKFHENEGQIYRIHPGSFAITPNALGPVIADNFGDEVPFVARSMGSSGSTIQHGKEIFTKDVYYADSEFLKVFSFPLIVGDQRDPLVNENTILITRKEALRLFNRVDVINEEVKLEGQRMVITGVLEDVPTNSSITFDFIAPLHTLEFARKPVWNNYTYFTSVVLAEGVSPQDLIKKVNQKVNEVTEADPDEEYFNIQPFADVHLQKAGKLEYEMLDVADGQYIYIFSAVAFFILVLGIVNYVNLVTARSIQRAKEVGIRKVSGAVKGQLVTQFLSESAAFVFLSLFVSVLIVFLVLDAFNALAAVSLTVTSLFQPQVILGLFGLGVLVSLCAGFYPAIVLSKFLPSQVLKGVFDKSRQGNFLRQSLVVFQFIISAFLFMATLVINQQFNYILNKDLGMNKDQVLTFSLPDEISETFSTFKAELLSHPKVLGASPVNNRPLAVGASHGIKRVNGDNEAMSIRYLSGDEDLMRVMSMEMLAGTSLEELSVPFDRDRPSVIINETAMADLGLTLEDAVGEVVELGRRRAPIQGVVKDFHFAPLTKKIGPLAVINDPDKYWRVLIKVSPDNLQSTLDFINIRFKNLAPESLFNYSFLDDDFEKMHKRTARLKTIFQIFSNMAIVIACLGMLGLISFTVQRRTKEVGVRKVLGASVSNIFMLISKDFMKLVSISLLIALPLGYYAVQEWLNTYAYRTEVGLGLLLIVVTAGLLLTLITIAYQAIGTARTNPAKVLRNE